MELPPVMIRAVRGVREDIHEYLAKRIPDARWVFDDRGDATETFFEALELAGDGACIQMEDDVFLTARWHEKVAAQIEAQPDELLQFFSRRKDDIDTGSRRDKYFSYLCCVYLPPGMAADILKYGREWGRWDEHPTGWDTMIDDYLREMKIRHWICIPSLVQHAAEPSLLGRRSSRRQSPTFVEPWT